MNKYQVNIINAAIGGCVSDCVWVLQRGGCSSCCCCGPADSLWRSNWGASPTSPSVYLLSSWSCLRRPSSRTLCVAGEASSSSPCGPLCCTSRSLGRRDSLPGVWIPPSSPMSASNRGRPHALACSPSPTRRCTRVGCPVSAERCPCTRGRCGGWRRPSGSCSRWTGWTGVGLHLLLCLALCGTTGLVRAGLWAAG